MQSKNADQQQMEMSDIYAQGKCLWHAGNSFNSLLTVYAQTRLIMPQGTLIWTLAIQD